MGRAEADGAVVVHGFDQGAEVRVAIRGQSGQHGYFSEARAFIAVSVPTAREANVIAVPAGFGTT
eukprot:1585763-Prymnesium_polylepis.2